MDIPSLLLFSIHLYQIIIGPFLQHRHVEIDHFVVEPLGGVKQSEIFGLDLFSGALGHKPAVFQSSRDLVVQHPEYQPSVLRRQSRQCNSRSPAFRRLSWEQQLPWVAQHV